MTTKTWNGSAADFNTASDWLPAGVPTTGDIAIINAGNVTVSNALPAGLTVKLNATTSNGSRLTLSNGTVSRGDFVQADDASSFTAVSVSGTSTNAGGITFSGQPAGDGGIVLTDAAGGGASQLINTGGISVVGQTAALQNNGLAPASGIVNNGMISFRNGGLPSEQEFVNTNISGTGTIRMASGISLQLGRAVSAGQTIVLEPGAGGQVLNLTDPSEFAGTISGLGAADKVQMTTPTWDSRSYSLDSNTGIGTWTFSQAGNAVAQVRFSGNLQQSAFTVSPSGTSPTEQTTITTSTPEQPIRAEFTDVDNAVSGEDAATTYTGPFAGLQWQYVWTGSDNVAMDTKVANTFIKGASGNDAIQVSSGNNVIDGGGGSNFLTGGSGNDTFFVDGTGGAITWSTIVNFHFGDQATIWGFHPGTSTLPITNSDGAPGATGVTIHSELSGAGTGVNASLTFAGVDRATLDAHFSMTSGTLNAGTPQAIDYLLIQYNK